MRQPDRGAIDIDAETILPSPTRQQQNVPGGAHFHCRGGVIRWHGVLLGWGKKCGRERTLYHTNRSWREKRTRIIEEITRFPGQPSLST